MAAPPPPIKKKPFSQIGNFPNLGKAEPTPGPSQKGSPTPAYAEVGGGGLAALPVPEDLSPYLALIELALMALGLAMPYWQGDRRLWEINDPKLLPGLHQLALRSIQKQDGLDEAAAAKLLLEQGDRTRNHLRLYLNHLTPEAIKGLAFRYAQAADLSFPTPSTLK
jgi:hypothetical protein